MPHIKGTDKNSQTEIQTGTGLALNAQVPASPTAGSINDTLSKAAGGNTFNKATDSLEMLSDKLGGYSGDGGAAQDDSVKSSLDLAHTDLDAIIAQATSLNNLFLTRRVIKSVTFNGGAGSGATGTVNLFTITGGVDIEIEAFCTGNLTDAGGTAKLEVGVSGNTALIIAQTTAVNIDQNEIWHDNTPDSSIELKSDANKSYTIYGMNIFATVGTENITGGTIVFSALYTPRTSNALVEAA